MNHFYDVFIVFMSLLNTVCVSFLIFIITVLGLWKTPIINKNDETKKLLKQASALFAVTFVLASILDVLFFYN